MKQRKPKEQESTSTMITIMYISVITTSPFYYGTHLPHIPSLPIQAISIFGNDKIVYLQSKGWMSTAACQLATFSYFYLVIVFTARQHNLVHTRLREHIMLKEDAGSSVCVRTLVDLFDKAEGARQTL